MSATEPWRPSVGGLWSDVAVGLIVYGAVIASPTVPAVVISGLAMAAGLKAETPLFLPMVLVGLLGLAMIVAGSVLLRIDQRDRRRRLQELDGLTW